MGDKRVKVPEGMLRAAWQSHPANEAQPTRTLLAVESALRWLSENPIEPTDEQIHEMYSSASEGGISFTLAARFCVEWQRRMFLAEDEDEAIRDLLGVEKTYDGRNIDGMIAHNQSVREAYRRGRERK